MSYIRSNPCHSKKTSSSTRIVVGSILSIAALLIFNFVQELLIFIHRSSTLSESEHIMHRGINILDGSLHVHHPVLTRLSQPYYSMEPGFLIEMNGLMVPEYFDCDIFNNGLQWGGHPYYVAFAPRWHQCHLHMAMIKSGLSMYQPQLPIIDEEYFEMVSVYDAVFNAKNQLVVAELGARWGTWGSRAAALWRRLQRKESKSEEYNLFFVENNRVHCDGLKLVMKQNRYNYTLECNVAKTNTFSQWADTVPQIDILHVDIQGAEEQFFKDGTVLNIMKRKVKRAIIGTHSGRVHEQIKSIFCNWIVQHEIPRMDEDVTRRTMSLFRRRLNGQIDRTNFDEIIRQEHYFNTSYGKIVFLDGELIIDNPQLSNILKPKLFHIPNKGVSFIYQ